MHMNACPVLVESPVLAYLHPSGWCGGGEEILWLRFMGSRVLKLEWQMFERSLVAGRY